MKVFGNLTCGFRREEFAEFLFFLTDQNFANNFRKGSPKEQSREIISKSVSEVKTYKEFLKKFHLVAMAIRVFNEIKFCEQFLKRTTQGTFLPILFQIDPAV